MNKPTVDDVVIFTKVYRDDPEFFAKFYRDDPEFYKLAIFSSICMGLLDYYLGKDCTGQLYGGTQSAHQGMRKARDYLRMPGNTDDLLEGIRRTDRIVWLAELLFNLQDTEGIDRIVADIQHGQLKASFEELDCAKQLKRAGIPFRFLPPSIIPREKTPDLEILLPDEQSVFYEIEGKGERTDLSINSVYATLDHARKQLPKEKPGMILLKIPEAWLKETALYNAMQKSLRRLFSQTHRVIAVNIQWEEYVQFKQGGYSLRKFRIEHNNNSRFLTPVIVDMLNRIGSRLGPEWIDLQKVVWSVFEPSGENIKY